MNWECRNAMRCTAEGCTTEGCTAKAEIEALREQLATMTKERDAYRSVAEGEPLDAYQAVCEQLAISQARIKELRGALIGIIYDICVSAFLRADKALATPDDSSALDAALKAERERCAKLILNTDLSKLPDEWKMGYANMLQVYADAIRSMK